MTARRLPPPLPADLPEGEPAEEVEYAFGPTANDDVADAPDDERGRREDAMFAIANGATRASVATRLGITPQRVGQLFKDWHGGEPALGRRRRKKTGSTIHAELKACARRMLHRNPRLTAQQLADSVRLIELADALHVMAPRKRRWQVFIDEVARDDPAIGARPTTRAQVTATDASGYTWVYGGHPGFIEYDGEKQNLMGSLFDGLPFASRTEQLEARDTSFRAPVGTVTTMRAHDQGDLRTLFLRVVRPKRDLLRRAGCKNGWLSLLPFAWRGDNAWINSALMFLLNLPGLGVLVEFSPAKRPQSKPVSEGGFAQQQKIHEDRAPNSTGRSPLMRGTGEPERFAVEHRISGRDIEDDNIRILVDAVYWGWDERSRRRPGPALEASAERFPIRTWQGPPGYLEQKLKRPIGKRTVTSHQISYNGRDYVKVWPHDPDLDPRNELPYPHARSGFTKLHDETFPTVDDDDVRMLDICDQDGNLLGVSVAVALSMEYGRPVSQFELDWRKEMEAEEKRLGRESRQEATSSVLRKNQQRARKRTARAVHTIEARLARRAETIGGRKSRRAAVALPAPVLRDPVAVGFEKRAVAYETPRTHPLDVGRST